MRIASVALIVVGIALMLLSPMWQRFASSSFVWSDDAAVQYTESVTEMHHANSEAALRKTKTDTEAALQARKQFHANQAKLSRARQFKQRGGPIMRLIGGILAMAGIALQFYIRQQGEMRPDQ